jgi:hypothetical protein
MIGVVLLTLVLLIIVGFAAVILRAFNSTPAAPPKPDTFELTQSEIEAMLRDAMERGIKWGLELATEKCMDGHPVCGLIGVV